MIDDAELRSVHAAVDDACRTGDAGGLPVLGFGEISVVVAWPPGDPTWALKRLPVFPRRSDFEAYAEVFHRYVAALGERGVDVLETSVATVDGPDGSVTGYLVQPALDPGSLGSALLAAAEPSPDHPVLTTVLDGIASVIDARVGFDGQFANWAQHGDRFVYLDLTTPMLRDERGRWEVDGRLMAAAAPWALRPALTRFVIPSIVARYHDPRSVVLDTAVNVKRLRLDGWVSPLLTAARDRIGVSLTEDDVRRDYRSEARTWRLLQAVRRADRAWQLRVRRRPYPFLVPDHTGW